MKCHKVRNHDPIKYKEFESEPTRVIFKNSAKVQRMCYVNRNLNQYDCYSEEL